MAKFFNSTADIVPIDYENRPEGFLENVVRTPQNVYQQKPVNILENFASMAPKPESYTGTEDEWVQENLSGEPFQNLVKALAHAKDLLDNRTGTDAENRAAAQSVIEAYEIYMGGVKRDRPQRLSGVYLSPDGREWNSWKPCADQREVLGAVFNAITTSGRSMDSDKVKRYKEAYTRIRQQYEETGKPFTEQEQRAFDEKMVVALGYAKQEELDIESLKRSMKAEADLLDFTEQQAYSSMPGYNTTSLAIESQMPMPKFSRASLITEEEVEQKREENLAAATGKMHNDISRDRSVLTWLECADALSSSANGIIAMAFLLGGDDEKVAELEDLFRKLDDKEKGTVAHFVGLSRGKVLERQWWTDAGRGFYRTTHEIFISPLQFGFAWGRVPAAYMAGAIKGEDVSWQALSEETSKRLADEALWESSTEHLEYEDYSFAEKGMKGLVEQLPIWATLMLGGVAGRVATGVGAGLTALRMASAGAAVARTAGVASSVAGWGGKAMLAMWYANESRDRYLMEGAPLWRANVMSTLSGVGQAFCDSVQGEMLLGKGLMGRPFARARNQFCNLLAESGAHSFVQYTNALATKGGISAVANLAVGASLDILGECYVEGVQKAIETLGLNLSVKERTLLQDVASDFWTEFAESVPTMVFSVGAGHAVSTSTVFKAKQTFASYNEAIRSMRSLSGVFAKERLPAQNVEFSIFTQTPDGRVVPSEAGLQKLRVAWLETKGNKERMKLLEGTRTGLTHSQAEMVNRLFMSEERIRRVGTIATAIKLGLASRTRTGEQFMWTPEGIVASIQAVLPDAKIVQEKDGASVISINGVAIRLAKGDLNKDIEANIENPSSGFLQSLWSTIKNKEAGKQFKSYEDFEHKVGEKGDKQLREKLVRSHVLGGSGYFKNGLGTIDVDGKKISVVGEITIDKLFAKGTTPAHEIVHAVSYILKTAKVLTDADIRDLRAMFGDPTKEDELFNEETAAEAIESYIKVGGFLEEAEQKAGIGVNVAKPNAFNRVLQLLGDAMVSMGMQETEYNPAVLASDPKVLTSWARGAAAQELVRKMDKADFTRLETDAASAMAEPLRQEKANLESLVENPVKPNSRAETVEATERNEPEGATEAQVEQQKPVEPVDVEGVQPTQMSGADEAGAVVAENATTEPVAEGEPVGNPDELSGNNEQLTEEQTGELSGNAGELPAEEQAPVPTPVGKPTAEAEALSEKTGVRADVIAQVAQVALGDPAFQVVEDVDAAKEAQDKEDANKASNTVIDAFFDVKRSVEEVPVENILVNDRITQFKRGADPKTGTTEADFIPKYIPSMSRPIRVMQFKDGKIEVITGRHRLDAARRSGFKTIPAIVYREADGMTVELAKAIDATENVLDRKGSAQDWVSFFKNSGLTSQELDQLGIHGGVKNKKVRAAEAIGTNGINDVVSFALDPNTSETRFHALGAIALAPKGVQRALLNVMLNKGIVDPVQLERMGKVLADKVSEPDLEQESLFGEDDEAMEYARVEGLGVSKIVRGLKREWDTLARVILGYKDMVLRKETKERLGIKDVNDKEELIQAQNKVKLEIAEWQGVLSKEQTERAYAIGKEEDEKAQKAKKDQTAGLGGIVRVLLHNGKRQNVRASAEKRYILTALSRVADGAASSVEESLAQMLTEKDEIIKTEKSLAKKRPQISQRATIEKARDLYLKDKDSWQLSTVAEESKKRGPRYSLDTIEEEATSPDAITQAEREAHEVWAKYHDANGNPKQGYRMAPNGKPSNLAEKQWTWVRTPSFMRWFGDWINDPENASKVVDENGEPKVVYHDSGEKHNVLSRDFARKSSDIEAIYFHWTRDAHHEFGNVEHAVFLNVRRPANHEQAYDSFVASATEDAGVKQREKLQREGYDGAIITPEEAGGEELAELAVFESDQVKSATDNVGTFDPDKRDIRYSIAPLYTGTWADYDKPSLHHVDSGAGGQIFGWGLYASTDKEVAERYAKWSKRLFHNGELVDTPKGTAEWELLFALRAVRLGESPSVEAKLEEEIAEQKRWGSNENKGSRARLERLQKALALYQEDKNSWSLDNANVYSQTWFTDREHGDESHLLVWNAPLNDLTKRALNKAKRYLGVTFVSRTTSGTKYKTVIGRDGREGFRVFGDLTQGDFYQLLADATSPKEASEALSRAGVDGVKYPVQYKEGDQSGWNYVSFRDDNLRIDHKWENGVQRYSLAEAETIADKLEEERKKIEANGGKLVLAYHGTDHRGFTKFERTDNVGYYFAGTRATAGSYIWNAGEEALNSPGLVDYQEALDFLRKGNEGFEPGLKTKWVFKDNEGKFVFRPIVAWFNGYDTKEEAEAAKNDNEHWKDRATVVKVDLMVDKFGDTKYYEGSIPYQDVIEAYDYVTGNTSGIYDVAIRMDNPLEIDAEGQGWSNIYVIPRDEDTKVYTEVSVWFDDEKGKVVLMCQDEFGEETEYEYDWIDDLLEGIEKNFGKAMRAEVDAIKHLEDVLNSGHSMDIFSKSQNENIYVYNEREGDGLVVSQKSTREIETEAKEAGYDGVIIHNVIDVGGGLGSDELGEDTVYISFNQDYIKSVDKITYADDGSIIPISQRLNWDNGGDMRFSLATPVETKRNLVAIHNVTEGNLKKIVELGGFAMPSVAITRDSIAHDTFGDVSVLFGKDTVDPRRRTANAIYSHDAWTPRFPEVSYGVDVNGFRKTSERILGSLPKDAIDSNRGAEYEIEEAPERGLANGISTLEDNILLRLAYVLSKEPAFKPSGGDFRKAGLRRDVSQHIEMLGGEDAFDNWIGEQFGEHILGAGIRNDRELFTPMGNRRTWKQLYEALTLETAIRAMRKEPEQGGGGLGISPVGASAKPFSSIAEVRQNKGLLKELSEEEHDKRTSSLYERYLEVSRRFRSNDNAEAEPDTLLYFFSQARRNKAFFKRLLEGGGYGVDDALVDDFFALMDDFANMPTRFFEAKPRRAVGFDEVKAWIVPDSIGERTLKRVEALGKPVLKYIAGDKEDRLRAVNDAADMTDARFSLATQEQNDPMANLQREAEEAGKPAPTGVQKAYGVYYPNASEDIRAMDNKRYSFATDAEAIIKKKRPDVKDVPAVVSELQKFSSSAERKAALHWFVRGAIRLPEDAPKVTQALGYAKRAKADALKYDSPMACMEDLHDFKPKAEPINPDTVPELSNKRTFDYGVTVYDVQDDRAGQRAMRRIINTHFGEDANPWCLLQGDGKGNLTEGAWDYWTHYNAIPKRVAFRDGKLLCFIANGRDSLACWDRQDKSHEGIPIGDFPAPENPYGIKTIQSDLSPDTGEIVEDKYLSYAVIAPLPDNPFGQKEGDASWYPYSDKLLYGFLYGKAPLPPNPYGLKEGRAQYDPNTGRMHFDPVRVELQIPDNPFGETGELSETWYPDSDEITYINSIRVGELPVPPNSYGITRAKAKYNLITGETQFLPVSLDVVYFDTPFDGRREKAYAFFDPNTGAVSFAQQYMPLPEGGEKYVYGEIKLPEGNPLGRETIRVAYLPNEGTFSLLLSSDLDDRDEAWAENYLNEILAKFTPRTYIPRFSLSASETLRDDVEKTLNTAPAKGKVLPGGTAVYLGDAPELFSKLDLPTGKVYAKANTLRKVAKTHGLTAEQMASVSDMMSSPVAIFADEGRGYILLTDASVPNAEGNNAPLMVYLAPAENGNLEASAFSGKPSDVSRFVRLANAGEMLYVDSAKVDSLPISDEVKQAITSGRVKPARSRGAKSAEDALNSEDKRYALYWLDPSLEEDPTPIFAQVAAERVATAKLSGKVDPLDGQMYKDVFGVDPEAVAKYVDEYLQKNGRAFQSTEELIQAIGAEAYARQRDNKSLDAYIAGFAEGAGQASYAAQLRVAQTEAMKQHMENISGADAWMMQCELGFSLSRTVLGMVDAERKMTKEQIAERVKKRRARARKKYLAAHKAEAGDKNAEKLFEQDAATSKDWERYREIFGDPEAMEREVERIKQAAQEQMNADKAEREAKRKKREENKKKKEGKKKEEKSKEEGRGASIVLEEKLTIPRDFLYAKGIDLADPETLMWFIQQYVMNQWMERENMARTPEEIAGDPRFVRDVQCTLRNALHDLAIDLCYSSRRDSVLKRADKILSAGSSLRLTRAIALAAFNAMHATLVKEKRAEITQGIIDGIDGTIGKGRFSEKKEQNDRTTSGDFARYLSKIRAILKMSDAEILRQREKWDAIVRHRSEDLDGKQDELLTNKDFNEGMEWIALIDKYGDHNHLMPGELDTLRAELMESVKGELQHTLEERKKFQESIDAVKNNFLLGILENAPKYKPERARSVFSKRFWEETAEAYQSAMHLFLGNLIHRSKGFVRKKAQQAQEEIEIQLGQAADKKNYFKTRWMDAIAQEMREIYGSPRACVNALKQKIPEHLNDRIAKQGSTLTVGQVLMLYAYSQQTDDYHTNIKLHKRDSKEYLDAIRQCLTDKEIALLTSMRNILVAVFPALQKEYKDITGVTVYTTRNYFPVKMKMDEHLGGDFRFFSPVVTAMQPRVRHSRDIDESVDALSLFVSRLEDYSHMLGYGKAGIFLRETLGSTEVLKAVRQAHGDSQYKRLINKTLDILAGTRAQKTSDGDQMAIFLKASRWVSLAALAFNIVSACKQIVSAPMAGAHEDVGFMRASMWLIKSMVPDSETRRAWSILRSSQGKIARYGLGLSADLVDAFSGTGRLTALKKFYDSGMSPITFGDALAGMSCGAGYYLMKEREFMDMGYSQEEAQARAEALTWTLIANTQQSSRVQDQPQIVNNHKFARLAMMFLNAPYQQSQFLVSAFQAMCRGDEGGARRFANVACTTTVVTVFIKLVDLFFDALFGKYHDKDDDEKDEMLKSWAIDAACTAVLNPMFNVPVVGETFHQTVLTLAEGKNRFYFVRTGIPVIDKISDVARSVTGQLTKPVDWSEMDTIDWTRYGAEWADLALKESLAPYRQLNKSSKNWTGKTIIEHAFEE